jgi:hypothetical protein
MKVKLLRPDIRANLDRPLEKAYDKQVAFLESQGTSYRSLKFEVVTATKHLLDPYRHYTFRVTQKYRAFCFKADPNTLEVFAINAHDY